MSTTQEPPRAVPSCRSSTRVLQAPLNRSLIPLISAQWLPVLGRPPIYSVGQLQPDHRRRCLLASLGPTTATRQTTNIDGTSMLIHIVNRLSNPMISPHQRQETPMFSSTVNRIHSMQQSVTMALWNSLRSWVWCCSMHQPERLKSIGLHQTSKPSNPVPFIYPRQEKFLAQVSLQPH